MSKITEPRFHYKIKNNQFEYPKYFEAYEKALTSVWNYKEVSMSEDLLNWELAEDTERKILGGILRAFTQTEVVIGEYWTNFVSKIFPKPEIISMCTAYGFFETIHAAAYNHLSATLGIDEYTEYIGDSLAQQKVEYLLNKIDSPKAKLAIFSGAAEGVALFSAFSILLSFCKEGKFKGLSQIISWSILDEDCVTENTQILTRNGWKYIKDYDDTTMEEIAQFNPETKEISFVKPLKYIKSSTNELYKIQAIDKYYQLLSPEHTVIYYPNNTNKIQKNTAKNWDNKNCSIPISGYLKKRKITKLDKHIISKIINNSTELKSNFFDDYYTYDNIPEGFMEELLLWNNNKRLIVYSKLEQRNIIFLQTVASISGYYCHIDINSDKITFSKTETLPADISTKEKITLDNPINTYCFKVPTQAFLIKLDGLISITGNCHSKMGSELFKDLVKEEGITKEEIELIIEGFQQILRNELAFLNNVFGNLTKINNLEKEAFINFLYSKYNQRLEQLGISPQYYLDYNQSLAFQISSWFDSLSSGNISQDFFAYAKDGSQYVAKPDFDISKVDWDGLNLI